MSVLYFVDVVCLVGFVSSGPVRIISGVQNALLEAYYVAGLPWYEGGVANDLPGFSLYWALSFDNGGPRV